MDEAEGGPPEVDEFGRSVHLGRRREVEMRRCVQACKRASSPSGQRKGVVRGVKGADLAASPPRCLLGARGCLPVSARAGCKAS
jgi:hypothetical protein